MYLAADISLGIGIPALISGGWLAWRNHSRANYALDVLPARSGAFATVSGAF